MKRREFIKVVSVSALAIGLNPLGAVLAADPYSFDPNAPAGTVFPQSVMSGDPKPASVMLWTRVQTTNATAEVGYQISKTSDFAAILAQGTYTTDASSDYTVRIKLTDLEAGTFYYYRFIYNNTASRPGRTKTAPAPDAATPIKFGFLSCQDYTSGFYAGLGILAQDNLDFVVYLGDYIYETAGAGFQGSSRDIKIPDGLDAGKDYGKAALTLADYRAIYKTYRTDPQMQQLNESFPFIVIWDDHEFSNDAWGDHATYFNQSKDETEPVRRKAANRVWYEFMPADIGAYDDSQTYDSSLRIYRDFSFGTLLDLIMTDERLYRSKHLIPEGPPIAAFGKPANSEIGSRYFVPKQYFDAVEAASPPLTMLGSTQKDWFKNKLLNSKATWKIWGNEVSLLRMLLDLTRFNAPAFYLNLDQWDGYNRERRELLSFMRDNGLKNVVAVTGDIHSFFAGQVYENYDDQSQPPVMVDFNGAGVASTPFYFALYGGAAAPGSPFAALEPLLRYNAATDTNGVDALILSGNPHMKHARTRSWGFATVTVEADKLRVAFNEVAVDRPTRSVGKVYNFTVPNGTPDIIVEKGADLPENTGNRWLTVTGFEVDNRFGFLDFWRNNGGLPVFGYPISPVLDEGGRKVQYFERNRFEAHPENSDPFKVQLGLLGVLAAEKVADKTPFAPVSKNGDRYYANTGHNLAPRFVEFWDKGGGLVILGYPICEEFDETVDGVTRKTQYFERAILRYFDENPPEYKVQGDLLGVVGFRQLYG